MQFLWISHYFIAILCQQWLSIFNHMWKLYSGIWTKSFQPSAKSVHCQKMAMKWFARKQGQTNSLPPQILDERVLYVVHHQNCLTQINSLQHSLKLSAACFEQHKTMWVGADSGKKGAMKHAAAGCAGTPGLNRWISSMGVCPVQGWLARDLLVCGFTPDVSDAFLPLSESSGPLGPGLACRRALGRANVARSRNRSEAHPSNPHCSFRNGHALGP